VGSSGIILAIDPGKLTGWAILAGGLLHSCGLASVVSFDAPLTAFPDVYPADHDLIIEAPEQYASGPLKGIDITQLAFKIGRIREHYKRATAATVLPKDWKGQVPKEIHNARVMASLNPGERHLATGYMRDVAEAQKNNVIDAIGIGVWYAKKLRVR
jgi:hypothetical protein